MNPQKRINHGGKRHGAGRHPTGKLSKRDYHICLEPDYAEYLSEQGSGNRSAGLALVIQEHKEILKP